MATVYRQGKAVLKEMESHENDKVMKIRRRLQTLQVDSQTFVGLKVFEVENNNNINAS